MTVLKQGYLYGVMGSLRENHWDSSMGTHHEQQQPLSQIGTQFFG